MPAGALRQCLLQHPVRELADHSRLLGKGDEGVREEQAAGRVAPPDEGLHARHEPGPGVDLGLVVEEELVPFEGVGQVAREGEARHAGALEVVAVVT